MHSTGVAYESNEDYVPQCDNELKPIIGRRFSTLDDGELCYITYAAACGFDVRRGPVKRAKDDGTIRWRYLYCNREGVNPVASDDLESDVMDRKNARRKVSKRSSCMARLVLHFSGGEGYIVNRFIEGHSHPLVSERYKHFLRFNRNLDSAHQNFVMNCARANIGPMRSFRLFKELVGSYDKVGCTGVEFKNFSRDLRAYVVGVDAQIMLDTLHSRREIQPNFTFEYNVDKSEKLTSLFWADTTSIKNYQIFGESVSFDATYSTNRYNMIFTPFTGKDNHGKCVTFGAGLLSNESVESYVWLFEKFKSCMGKSPKLIITDQDPAMKIAIERILPETRHRFCMWHIMLKVSDKLPVRLKDDESFTKRFNGVVWSNLLEPLEFEKQWKDTLEEFGLADDKWFSTMYDLRSYWIPAFFKDCPMSGLFRTTSMSESENSFFGRYFNKRANLIEFLMHFDSAIDAQRHAHDHSSSVDESCFPKMKTRFKFERHAASIYTIKIFKDVQEEIVAASFHCCVQNVTAGLVDTVYEVRCGNDILNVVHSDEEDTITCDCKHFERIGLLCRHVFLVFKNLKIHEIPEKYIVSRWTKYACSNHAEEYNQDKVGGVDRKRMIVNQLHAEFYSSLGMTDGNLEQMEELLRDLIEVKEKFKAVHAGSADNNGKKNVFDRYYGASIPNEVSVLPPDQVKTKGSGSRLKSRKEKALRSMNKPMRKCNKCKQMAHHDARNCDKVL